MLLHNPNQNKRNYQYDNNNYNRIARMIMMKLNLIQNQNLYLLGLEQQLQIDQEQSLNPGWLIIRSWMNNSNMHKK